MILFKKITTLATAALFLHSCDGLWNTCIDGNGDITTNSRELGSFNAVHISGDFHVDIDTAGYTSATVRADKNLIEFVETQIIGNTLFIESRNGVCLNPSDPVEVNVTVPYFNGIYLEGSGYVHSFGTDAGSMEIVLSGSGRIDIAQVHADDLYLELEGSGIINTGAETINSEVHLEGSGEIRVAGSTVSAGLSITGSGKVKAGSFDSKVCEAYLSGSGVINTKVEEALNVTIIGDGIVYYTGDPVVEIDIEGSGRVIRQ